MGLIWGRETTGGAVAAVLGVGLVVGLGFAGWPGQPFDCAHNACFCERSTPGLVHQVGNTWSNLGAVLAGVVVGGQASRHRRARTLAGHQRPGADVLGHLFPWVLVFQGVGSMLFHGGLTVWGSALDAMSMFATTGLLVATNLHRLGWVGARGVLGLFATLMAVGVTLGFGSQALVVNLVFVQFSVILGSEALLGHQGRTSTSAYFRGGLAVYLAGSVVWFLSGEPGLPFCEPASPWQGHGLWHLTSAAAVWLFAQHAFRNLAGAEIPAFRPAAVPPSTAAVASRLEPLLGAGAEPEFGTR